MSSHWGLWLTRTITISASSSGHSGLLGANRSRSLIMDAHNIPSHPSPLVTPTRSVADIPNQVRNFFKHLSWLLINSETARYRMDVVSPMLMDPYPIQQEKISPLQAWACFYPQSRFNPYLPNARYTSKVERSQPFSSVGSKKTSFFSEVRRR